MTLKLNYRWGGACLDSKSYLQRFAGGGSIWRG